MKSRTDAIGDIAAAADNPNSRYDNTKNLGTWSSVSDLDTLLNTVNRANAYKSGNITLSLGNYVTIQDGTYNAIWEIAGFDLEHNQIAADGTIYDNGYGILMIPKTYIGYTSWNSSSTVSGGYIASSIHTTYFPNIVSKLKNVLGNHIISRNVLLSNGFGMASTGYTWTTSYATLMSIGQFNGTFGRHTTAYDDGEANYKLPIFNNEGHAMGTNYWVRNMAGPSSAYYIAGNNTITNEKVNGAQGARPVILIR